MTTRQYLATAMVAFFMAFGLAYIAPTADGWDGNDMKQADLDLMHAKQAAADSEVKLAADSYAHMSDTERMRGVVYEP